MLEAFPTEGFQLEPQSNSVVWVILLLPPLYIGGSCGSDTFSLTAIGLENYH